MKILGKEYGKSIVAVIIGLMIFGIIFAKISYGDAKGLMHILAKETEYRGMEYDAFEDTKKSVYALERKRPVITYCGRDIIAGTPVKIEDLFEAKDADGISVNVEITQILNQGGTELLVTGEQLLFPRQGIYQIFLSAKDSQCTVAKSVMTIPVRSVG